MASNPSIEEQVKEVFEAVKEDAQNENHSELYQNLIAKGAEAYSRASECDEHECEEPHLLGSVTPADQFKVLATGFALLNLISALFEEHILDVVEFDETLEMDEEEEGIAREFLIQGFDYALGAIHGMALAAGELVHADLDSALRELLGE